MTDEIRQQLHGYRSGHQLLDGSITLDRKDQDIVDRLSDIAGPLAPGEKFAPYFTGYPLPSGNYYVLARTEQDLEVPRAGCVLTHSLIIPMLEWRDSDPARAWSQLSAIPLKLRNLTLNKTGVQTGWPGVEAPLLDELVEALFLEKRAPTVVFDTRQADVITARLLASLWPDLRAAFAFCTFSLAPRSIAGRPFDLLFAPKIARSRFSDWNGRRVDGPAVGVARAARHRWTAILEEKIFRSAEPSLVFNSDRPKSPEDGAGSEADLRLTLLWEELKLKVPTSPTAALGLIDIAKSQVSLHSAWKTIEPMASSAVDLVSRSYPPDAAWSFIANLGQKLDGDLEPALLADLLEAPAENLFERDAPAALTFLRNEELPDSLFRSALYSSVGDAIGHAYGEQLLELLSGLEPGKFARLALKSEVFSHWVLADDYPLLVALLGAGISEAKLAEREELLDQLLPRLTGPQQGQLLPALLRGANKELVVHAADTIWERGDNRSIAVADILCDVALVADAKAEVRDVFNSAGSGEAADHAIQSLLFPQPDDVWWLLTADGVARTKRPDFLANLVRNWSEDELERAFAEPALIQAAIHHLASSPAKFASEIVRLMTMANDADAWLLTKAIELFSVLDRDQRYRLALVITRFVAQAKFLEPKLLNEALKKLVGEISIAAMMRDINQPAHFNAVLVQLAALPSRARSKLVHEIDEIVELASRTSRGTLQAEGIASLSKLLEGASAQGGTRYIRACATALALAMGLPQLPMSPLIVASFPAVYNELRKDNDSYGFFSIFSFRDWDKCKTARNELVATFMRSKWPPEDLALAGLGSGDLGKIIERVAREYKGTDYLGRILAGLHNLDDNSHNAILPIIRRALD